MSLKILCVQKNEEAKVHLDRISKRISRSSQKDANKIVEEILQDVEKNGDAAILKYTEKFDGFSPNPIHIDPKKLLDAWNKTPTVLQEALKTSKKMHS